MTRLKRTPLKRSGSLPRTRPVNRRNAHRKTTEFARCYGSRDRVAFVKTLQCIVPGCLQVTPSDNAHVPSRSGMSRKGDARRIVPLCRWHHTESISTSLHVLGKADFEQYHGIDLNLACAEVEALFAEWDGARC